ncbi:MAG: outer membrane beta-barrel domain-containing protein [Pseudomonadota bacterium]
MVRKPFLKVRRLELVPTWGVTLNDNMIRHVAANAQLNYYLTDVLGIGVEVQRFWYETLDTYFLVGAQDRRSPTLNRYNYSASLNFHYAPIYAKVAVLDNRIIHWEGYFTAGVGMTETQVIPRDPAVSVLGDWKNTLITPSVGFSLRIFLSRWLTVHLGIRDYVFVDRYEDKNRERSETLEQSMKNADHLLVNHVMFQAGISLWYPTSFQYTTFR